MLYVKKVKLHLTKDQQLLIDSQSKISNWLYNHYLAVGNRYYRMYKKRLSYQRINNKLSKFKDRKSFLKTVNNTVLKNTLRTLEKATIKFFKEKKVGFPKFKSWKRQFRSLEYDSGKGFKIIDKNRLRINFGKIKKNNKYCIPFIKVKLSEAITEKPLQMTITKDNNKYYTCFRYEKETPETKTKGDTVALDLNQSNLFASVNDKGESVITDKPTVAKYFDKAIDKVKSKRDRCKKWSRRYKYLNKAINRLYRKRREQIKLMAYTIAHRIAQKSKLVIVGDYVPFKSGIKNINHGTIAQGLVGQFRQILLWVCEKSGVETKIVDEYRTSKECSDCGNVKKNLTLKDRVYRCEKCGLVIDRDVNSAINIMNKVLPRTGESHVVRSTASWKWMSNHLNVESLQINNDVPLCAT